MLWRISVQTGLSMIESATLFFLCVLLVWCLNSTCRTQGQTGTPTLVMKHGKLVHIDGAAHHLHHDQRKRTAQEITAFLNTL
jgi:pimeloyl-ACP methyl ester carboxylesterase